MSGSEAGLVTGGEPFGVGLQKSPLEAQSVIQNMRLGFSADGTTAYKPFVPPSPSYRSSGIAVAATVAGDGSAGGEMMPHGLNINNTSSEPLKKKRGRPRKYGPDGSMALALNPAPASVPVTQSIGGFSQSPATGPGLEGSASPTSLKKARGRPPGSGRKQQLQALGSVGFGFIPHVLTVKTGEDVSSKIMSLSQNGPRAICILSANGAISNVTLLQPATSGGTVTYEGRFEILSLSGSFLLSESSGQRGRTGGLSVLLSSPDGGVLGGSVAGLLIAATPIQVVLGSFMADGRKESKSAVRQAEQKLSAVGGGPTVVSSPSRGTLSESSGGPLSPFC